MRNLGAAAVGLVVSVAAGRRFERPARPPPLGRRSLLSWLLNNRRLIRRHERKAEHFQAFADLGCALLAYRRWAKVTT